VIETKRSAARIVVVEDEPDIATFLRDALRKEGFRASAAFDAQEALELLRREPADLVILDLMLPDMSGLEVLKQLKRHEETAFARVIVVSARSEELDRVLAFEFGADDYVTKPFSPRELMLRVKAVLQRAQGASDKPGESIGAGPIEIDARGARRRTRDPAHADGVPSARGARPCRGAGPLTRVAAVPGLGLRFRSHVAHRRHARAPPAQQAGTRGGLARHGSRHRLSHPGSGRRERLAVDPRSLTGGATRPTKAYRCAPRHARSSERAREIARARLSRAASRPILRGCPTLPCGSPPAGG
jgi:CheY-like chemotaxis protein